MYNVLVVVLVGVFFYLFNNILEFVSLLLEINGWPASCVGNIKDLDTERVDTRAFTSRPLGVGAPSILLLSFSKPLSRYSDN